MNSQNKTQFNELVSYIHSQWDDLTVSLPEDSDSHLGLPHPFVAPSVSPTDNWVFREQFYWDTYFTILGLYGDQKYHELICGMVDNLLSEVHRLGYVPNSNNRIHLGRSQPPLLSSMVRLAYQLSDDKRWLEDALQVLEEEYHTHWRGLARKAHPTLSRYYHADGSHRGAEDESGWDYTNRFDSRAADFLPVDLNAFLYKYELDIGKIHEILGHESTAWKALAHKRKSAIDKMFWDGHEGFYFDYDFINNKPSPIYSLAAYVPMFFGLASRDQAKSLVKQLDKFQTKHGLTTTAIDQPGRGEGQQWTAPNTWAPLIFIVSEALSRYGYDQEAKKVALDFVTIVNNHFHEDGHGHVLEKYNAVDPTEPPKSAVYPGQVGFAWTNAVVVYLVDRHKL